MLSRALLDCCKYVMSRDVTNIQMSVIEYIHGGVNGYNNKMQMMREISTPIKEILGTEEVANKVLVVPEYFEDLVKIIVILIGESSYIKDVTRYIEIMQHEVLLEKSIEYTQIIGLEYSSVAHKIAKDIIIFYLKTNRIDIHFFDKLFLRWDKGVFVGWHKRFYAGFDTRGKVIARKQYDIIFPKTCNKRAIDSVVLN